MAGWAGILNADFGLIFLLARMAESNQWRFANHQFRAIQERPPRLHLKGKLEADRFHAGKLSDGEMNLRNLGFFRLFIPPVLESDDQRLGHVCFMHRAIESASE